MRRPDFSLNGVSFLLLSLFFNNQPIKGRTRFQKMIYLLKEKYNISEKFIFLDKEKSRIEIDLCILEKIALKLKKKGCECFMIEEYPTADRLEVERIPLPL